MSWAPLTNKTWILFSETSCIHFRIIFMYSMNEPESNLDNLRTALCIDKIFIHYKVITARSFHNIFICAKIVVFIHIRRFRTLHLSLKRSSVSHNIFLETQRDRLKAFSFSKMINNQKNIKFLKWSLKRISRVWTMETQFHY